MKFSILSLGLLSLSAASVLSIPSKAQAVCVGVDVPTQIAIHGEGTTAHQQSTSQFGATSDCFGNTTVNTGTQVYTGNGDISQTQDNTHYLSGSDESGAFVEPFVETDNLFFSVPTQVNLDVLPNGDYYGNNGLMPGGNG